MRPYFDYWLNQQAKARDAATARHTYIPYSAIPEIAAQAAAEAHQLQQGSNNSTSPPAPAGTDTADAYADSSIPCSSTVAAAGNAAAGACNATEQPQAPPVTPRRSRSAPNLAELQFAADPADTIVDALAAAVADSAEDEAMQEDEEPAGFVRSPASAPTSSIIGLVPAVTSSSSSKQRANIAESRAASINIGTPTLPGIHTDDRFFYWLDDGAGRHVDLTDRGVSRGKLESERVQYLTESERNQLEVTVDASTGLLVYKLSGQTVHTGSELSLVHLRASAAAAEAVAAAAGSSAPAAAAAAVDSAGPVLQNIPEAAEEEEEEEEQQQFVEDEQPGSQQKQRRQQQVAALQHMQEQIRHPQTLFVDQQQQQLVRQRSLQQMQQQQLQEGVAGTATPPQDYQHPDVDMADAGAVSTAAAAAAQDQAVHCTPSRRVSSTSAGEAATAATPSAAAYGAVAGHDTPGTTGVSQRRWSAAAAGESSPDGPTVLSPPTEQQQQGQLHAAQQQEQQSQQQQGLGSSSGASHPPGLLKIKEKPCKWIYVLDTSGRLFVHAKYRGKFHHSSFLQGGAVLSAGGIVVEHGRIMKLTADSGHYRPNFDSFMSTVQMLKDWGADLTQTKLSAKHIKCPHLPDVPIN